MALEFKVVIKKQDQSENRSAVASMEAAKKMIDEARKSPDFLSARVFTNADVIESSPLFESGPING